MKKEKGVDEKELQNYFPIDHIVATTMEIYETLLGLKIDDADCQVWHESVKCYHVYDSDSDKLLGQFYLDLYKRANKGNVAQVSQIFNYQDLDDNFVKPVAHMQLSIKPDEKTITFDMVKTFFHEFGHIMHHVCSKPKYDRLSEVEQDFVELPSQMLENWVWDKQILKKLSKHIDSVE